MARRPPQNLNEQRNDIRRRWKRGLVGGGRSQRKVVEAELGEIEVRLKKAQAVLLKASDFPNTYISETIGVSVGTVRKWFSEDEVKKEIAEVQDKMVDGALMYLQTYAIEAIEGILEIGRKSVDSKVALQAWQDVLDRMGVTKVNKSERLETVRDEISIAEEDWEKFESLPEDTQRKLAELSEEMQELIENAKGTG
jgi:GTP-dependent phosphoenolpyruvate carboxykinase